MNTKTKVILYRLVVIVLILLAVIQFTAIINLRYQGIQDILHSGSEKEENSINMNLLKPAMIYVSTGMQKDRFACVTTQTQDYTGIYDASEKWLKNMLKGCHYDSESRIFDDSLQDLETQSSVHFVYETNFSIEVLFAEEEMLWDRDFFFNEIWMFPSVFPEDTSYMILANTVTDQALRFVYPNTSWKNKLNQDLLSRVENACETLGEDWYRAKTMYPSIFSGSEYCLVQSSQENFPMWERIQQQVLSETEAQKVTSHLFGHEDQIRIEALEEGWLLWDEESTIRCSTTGTIDYVCTPVAEEKIPLSEAYDIAWDFLQEELSIQYSVVSPVLTSYAETEHGYSFVWDLKLSERRIEDSSVTIETYGTQIYRFHCDDLQYQLVKNKTQSESQSKSSRDDQSLMLEITDHVQDALNRLGVKQCDSISQVLMPENNKMVLYWKVSSEGQVFYEPVN